MSDANIIYQRQRLDHTRRKFESLDLPNLSGLKYLDLGCNSGAFCEFALEAGAAAVAGVDIDQRLVDYARQHVPGAEFFQSRFEEIDLESRKFDVITIASAIHYSQDFLLVVEKIFNCLELDGLLVIEGGLFDPMGSCALNTPVPNWRQIGDHCRHPSRRFISDVLFPDSDVSLTGPSLQQGGDNLSRYSMKISRNFAKASRVPREAVVELEAFMRALAMSYDTIQPKYALSSHMETIKRVALLGSGSVDKCLEGQDAVIGLIAAEIAYCTNDWASTVLIKDCYRSETSKRIAEHLKGKGISANVLAH